MADELQEEKDQWEFGSPKEMRDAIDRARRPPLTASRVGEFIGGFVGVFVGGAICVLYSLFTHRFKLAFYAATLSGCLFGGAYVGKQAFAVFNRRRSDSRREKP